MSNGDRKVRSRMFFSQKSISISVWARRAGVIGGNNRSDVLPVHGEDSYGMALAMEFEGALRKKDHELVET